jgi:asparagine synthase (glutamine-hydrolysing)
MNGYFGKNSVCRSSLGTLQLGSIGIDSSGRMEGTPPGPVMLLEGRISRFVDSTVSYQPAALLDSLNELYQAHGESFVSKLDGHFLLFFSPGKDRPCFLVNNRQQATRLYFARTNDGFFFSGSLRMLLENSRIERKPNFGSIRSFLANGFTISDQTQIQGVHKMLPADYIVFDGTEAKRRTYWPGEMKFERRPFNDLEAKLDEYEQVYRDGIRRHLEGGQPKGIGALLSGGHDTSFLVAQLSQVIKQPLHTFTVTFPGWKFDEGSYAKNIAEKFGAIHHPVPFGPEHLDRAVGLILSNEEPVVGSSLPLFVLAEAASSSIDMLFGGDGGDTLWGEYYPVGEYHRWTHRLPLSVRRALHRAASRLRSLTDWERFWELEHVAGLFSSPDYHRGFMRKLCTYRHFGDSFQAEILSPEVFAEPYSESHLEVEFRDDNFNEALIEGKLYNAFYTYQGHHTTKLAEYNGMQLILPTVEKDVIDFICGLPANWINGGTPIHRLCNNKSINRRFHKVALSRYLKREEIYNRSFDIPWYGILRPRKVMLERLLARLLKRGWYSEAALRRLFSEFMTQKVKDHELLELKHHGYRIFTLLSLEIWSIEYLDGRSSPGAGEIALEDYLA